MTLFTRQSSSFRFAVPLAALLLVACCGCWGELDLPATQPTPVGGAGSNPVGAGGDDASVGQDSYRVLPDCETDSQCADLLEGTSTCRPGRCFLGECELSRVDDGASCDDGDFCTLGDHCSVGVCLPGKATDCSDDNPCTDDLCAQASGSCVHIDNGAVCAVEGGCAVGVCTGGACLAQSKLFVAIHAADIPTAVTAIVALDDGRFAVIANVELADEVTAARWLRLGGDGAQQVQGVLPLGWAADAASMPTGGAVVVGRVRLPSGDLQGRAVALAQAATVAWMRDYGGEKDDVIQAIAPAPGGGWAAAGTTWSKGQGGGDLWLLRLTPTGHPLLDYSYGSSDVEAAEAVTVTSSGSYVMAGTQTSDKGNVDGVILAIANDAGLVWMAQYGGPYMERPLAVVQRPAGTLLFAGVRALNAAGERAFWLGALDSEGNKLWSRHHALAGDAMAQSMVALPDGGAVLIGADRDVDLESPGAWQPRALRIDKMGNMQWSRTWSWEAGSILSVGALLGDGGLVLAGRRTPSAGATVAVLRTDPWGHADCATAGNCAQLSPSACDDGLLCSADDCAAQQGCTHSWLDDGSPCAIGLACAANKCTP